MKIEPFGMSEAEYADMLDNNGGFCVKCRSECFGVEPDARKYHCDSCGEDDVYGVEELLMMGLVEIV